RQECGWCSLRRECALLQAACRTLDRSAIPPKGQSLKRGIRAGKTASTMQCENHLTKLLDRRRHGSYSEATLPPGLQQAQVGGEERMEARSDASGPQSRVGAAQPAPA